MFKKLKADLDGILDREDGGEVFVLGSGYFFSVPIWKVLAFYLYTFFIGEDGEIYRISLKCAKYAYTLRYRLFKIKVNRYFRF
jgi:hypothetical protein